MRTCLRSENRGCSKPRESKMLRAAPLLIFLTASLAAAPIPAPPHVTARQGTAALDSGLFESPMILDLPLPNLHPFKPGVTIRLPDVRKYICDNNVSLSTLDVTKRYNGPKKARQLELIVSGFVSVTDSYDRRVDIKLRLKDGEEILTVGILRNYKAEERRVTPFRLSLLVDESKLQAAYSPGRTPILELTLTVHNDS